MQFPERPFDGEAPGDGAPSYEWLDEWLCEYVDGTMDPSVEAVFEQYVEANPELKAHVERLRQTRELLCGCEGEKPESSLTATAVEVERDVDDGLRQRPVPSLFSAQGDDRAVLALALASSVAVALVVGFLAGSVLVEPSTLSSGPATAIERSDAPLEGQREASPRSGAVPSGPLSGGAASPSDGVSFAPPMDAPAPSADTGRTASTFMTVRER
ncbi:MAG: hypothetical protein V5A58_08605 [Salinibacter sp.]|uniref:anti-sigma factor n=1 Tax=Salinibacter sp. TaxID=2065818 RepID=UPI002FC38A06